jgi:hypothetical protein
MQTSGYGWRSGCFALLILDGGRRKWSNFGPPVAERHGFTHAIEEIFFRREIPLPASGLKELDKMREATVRKHAPFPGGFGEVRKACLRHWKL